MRFTCATPSAGRSPIRARSRRSAERSRTDCSPRSAGPAPSHADAPQVSLPFRERGGVVATRGGGLSDVPILEVGDMTIVAFRDVDGAFPLADTFEDSDPPGGLASLPERFPDEFGSDTWRFRVHCFLLRSPTGVVLIDTGIGPEDSVSGREL